MPFYGCLRRVIIVMCSTPLEMLLLKIQNRCFKQEEKTGVWNVLIILMCKRANTHHYIFYLEHLARNITENSCT